MSVERLPSGWARAAFGELVQTYQNGCGIRRSSSGISTVVLRLADVASDDGAVASHGLREVLLSESERLKYRLQSGDLLVYRVNGSRSIAGRVVPYRGPDGYTFCDHFIRLRLSEAVDPAFCALAFRTQTMRADVENGLVSSAGQHTISQGTLAELEFTLPPLNEQRRIVAKLEALLARSRRAKEALDAIPALLERFRQSVLAAAFRGDLTRDWRAANPDVEPASKLLERIRSERRRRWEEAELERMRAKGKVPKDEKWKERYPEPVRLDATGLPALPSGWAWSSLDELLLGIEAGESPKAEGRPAGTQEQGVLKVSAVSWGRFNPQENKALPVGYRIDPALTVRAGDLLISRANTVELVGAVVLVESEHPNLMLSDKTLRLVPVDASLKEFLLFALRTHWVREVFEEDATGTSDSMRNLSQGKIRSAPIALAPIAEQEEFVRQVKASMDTVDVLEEIANREGSRLERLEQSLLTKAFRGELVPQDPADEPASVLLQRIRAERETADTKTNPRPKRRRETKVA